MKPVRPHMFSLTQALRLALRDQPRLLEGKTRITVRGELYSVGHDKERISPASSKEHRSTSAEQASYTGQLHKFLNASNPDMAGRIQRIIFPGGRPPDPTSAAGVFLYPRPRARASSADCFHTVHELKDYWSRANIPQPDMPMRESTVSSPLPHDIPAEIATPPTTDDVLFGLDAVDNYDNQGIPRSYLEKTQAVANQTNMIIAIRPVEGICRTLIEEGVASKGLNIKGKSSNWGPMAGYIPYDQKYSKLAAIPEPARRQQLITEANAMNAKAVTLQGVEIDQLSLSPGRWQELTELGQIRHITEIAPGPPGIRTIRFQSSPRGQPAQSFEGRQQDNGHWKIYTKTGKPLQIIPKTADFDLFFSFTHFENIELATVDKLRPFDPLLGIYSDRDQTLIKALNKVYNRGPGKDMVHHGQDVSNPQTDLEANLPATVFIPDNMLPMGVYTQSPLLIKSMPELIRLFRTMRDSGIRIESNELWGDLQAIVKEQFKMTRMQFERRKSTS